MKYYGGYFSVSQEMFAKYIITMQNKRYGFNCVPGDINEHSTYHDLTNEQQLYVHKYIGAKILKDRCGLTIPNKDRVRHIRLWDDWMHDQKHIRLKTDHMSCGLPQIIPGEPLSKIPETYKPTDWPEVSDGFPWRGY